eukprot:TRINITY_DN58147_c0_g1_i1.p1 TRINITY_DN58147_c0_g1~~TRINITY_DN58147_c0_g1_i1.p1  ORF type:complete len:441 (-),score=83.10 TRINITY_DN58147_c0_g1_i1:109-1395(-)
MAQFFRIVVHRVRFDVAIMLRTHFGVSPTDVPFTVRTASGALICAHQRSSDIGVASFDAPAGRYQLKVEPGEDSPFVQAVADIAVYENGSFHPTDCKMETKNVDVKICLVTPDGQPAPSCLFHISPRFDEEAANSGRSIEMAFRTDSNGVAMATMGLLEPYIFKVKSSGKVMEYMPQHFAFQTDRRTFTAVVARAILGMIPERHVAFVVDSSGSMQVYMEDIKVAINSALVQQFHRSQKRFNIITFTQGQVMFRPDLVDCSAQNIQDAMQFCESIVAGGESGAVNALEKVFLLANIDAAYLLTDGKCDVGDTLLNRLRALYFSHPQRPKVHTIGINCLPRGHTWRGLSAMATLTEGRFRPVCLEQDAGDPVVGVAYPSFLVGENSALEGGLSVGLDLQPLQEGTTTEEGFTSGGVLTGEEGDGDVTSD